MDPLDREAVAYLRLVLDHGTAECPPGCLECALLREVIELLRYRIWKER